MRSLITSATLLLMALMAGCKQVKESVQVDTFKHTEVRSGVSPRDTLLTVPASSVEASLPLPAPGTDLPPTTARSERAWSTVSIAQGVLTHAGGCDTLALAATLWDRWERTRQDSTYVRHSMEVVYVTRTPKWAWYAAGLAALLTLWRLWPLLLRFIKPI